MYYVWYQNIIKFVSKYTKKNLGTHECKGDDIALTLPYDARI